MNLARPHREALAQGRTKRFSVGCRHESPSRTQARIRRADGRMARLARVTSTRLRFAQCASRHTNLTWRRDSHAISPHPPPFFAVCITSLLCSCYAVGPVVRTQVQYLGRQAFDEAVIKRHQVRTGGLALSSNRSTRHSTGCRLPLAAFSVDNQAVPWSHSCRHAHTPPPPAARIWREPC